MYISNLKKRHQFFFNKWLFIFTAGLMISVFLFAHFISTASPYVESKAKFIAVDIINSSVSEYINEKGDIFTDIISPQFSKDGTVSYANVNSRNINLIKSELATKINNALKIENEYSVSIPLSSYFGISMLSGISSPIRIKIHPVSKVLVDFENDFSAQGINQTHLFLSLKINVTVMITTPGIRKSVHVSTSVPVGESVFMGNVPKQYFNFSSPGTFLPQQKDN